MFIMPFRRGMPVVPGDAKWSIKRNATDATSASLRNEELEGHACHARRSAFGAPWWRRGPDERVPPTQEICLRTRRTDEFEGLR